MLSTIQRYYFKKILFLFCYSAVPDAPGTPDATHITGESITMCWTRPRSDGGNEIKCYILERREKKSLRWVKVSSKRPITELRHRVTKLTEGNEYEFRVMAENGAGVGPASSTSRLFRCREPTSAPSAPTVIKVDLVLTLIELYMEDLLSKNQFPKLVLKFTGQSYVFFLVLLFNFTEWQTYKKNETYEFNIRL